MTREHFAAKDLFIVTSFSLILISGGFSIYASSQHNRRVYPCHPIYLLLGNPCPHKPLHVIPESGHVVRKSHVACVRPEHTSLGSDRTDLLNDAFDRHRYMRYLGYGHICVLDEDPLAGPSLLSIDRIIGHVRGDRVGQDPAPLFSGPLHQRIHLRNAEVTASQTELVPLTSSRISSTWASKRPWSSRI